MGGKRGGLYRHFLEFVDAKKPKAFVAENVKGLLTANKGLAIETILKDFESIAPGYIVKPHLYNFAEYGVPQFRERVLIVGIRVDTGFDFKHPLPTHGPNADKPYITAGQALQGVEKISDNNELINCKDKTKRMLELIPEGGNFTDIPKDNPFLEYTNGLYNLKSCLGKLECAALDADILQNQLYIKQINNQFISVEENKLLSDKRNFVNIRTAKIHEYEASLLLQLDTVAENFFKKSKNG